MSIDEVIRKHHEDRAREFHDVMVRAGLRPKESRMEDYRPKHEVVDEPVKGAGQRSEAAE